jgi:DNA-binding response OmpR family regulator
VHRDRHARPARWASVLTLLTAAYVAVYLVYVVWSESPSWETGPPVHGTRALRLQGYVVLEAEDGVHGLEISAQHPHAIDLVVSDVRRPRLIGPDMVAQLRAERPGLRAMFVSGYTSLDRGVPASLIAAQLLEKPFTLPTLFRRVRAALDGPPPEYPDRASDPEGTATAGAMAGDPDEGSRSL